VRPGVQTPFLPKKKKERGGGGGREELVVNLFSFAS
jgi:hypothetical protein